MTGSVRFNQDFVLEIPEHVPVTREQARRIERNRRLTALDGPYIAAMRREMIGWGYSKAQAEWALMEYTQHMAAKTAEKAHA